MEVLLRDLREKRRERARHHEQDHHQGADTGVAGDERETLAHFREHVPAGARTVGAGHAQRKQGQQPDREQRALAGEGYPHACEGDDRAAEGRARDL